MIAALDVTPAVRIRGVWLLASDAERRGVARDRSDARDRRVRTQTVAAQVRPFGVRLRPTVSETPVISMDSRKLRHAAEQILLTLAEDTREQHSLADAIERYRFEHLLVDGLAASTIVWREQTCDRLLKRFGGRPVDGRWRDAASMLYRDLSPVMASMTCNTLGRILNLAGDWGWRAGGHDLRGLCRIRSKARDRVLALVERRSLLRALEQFDTPRTMVAAEVVRFALHTGWRVGEATAIAWEHVTEDLGTVYLPSTKAGAQTRAIGQEASAVIARQPSRGRSAWVFPAMRANRHIDRRQPQEVMRLACERAGIKGASLHTLRHTRATVSAQLQLPTTSVALALGHTTEFQTSKYQHVDLDDVREAATVVDSAMFSDRKVKRGG